jgi:hypothetical protein
VLPQLRWSLVRRKIFNEDRDVLDADAELFRQRIQSLFCNLDEIFALHPSPLTQTAHLHGIASVVFLIVVTFIFRDVSFIVLFLVWLFPKKDIASRRAIRKVCVEALWAYSAHVHMVLCARWQEQQDVSCRRCRDQLAEDESLGEDTMSPRTLFISRLIGLYCIVIGLSMMTRRQATVETVTALLQNSSMMLIVGIITLATASGVA